MIDQLGKPDFFPKVERADKQQRSKSKGADASELLTSSSAPTPSGSSVKQSSSKNDPAPKTFDQALRKVEIEKPQPKKVESYNSQGEVNDGSEQPQDDNEVQGKITRQGLDAKSKKEMESKAAKSSEFVMPEMLPSKFSVPKHGLETELTENEDIPEMATKDGLLKQHAVSDFVKKMQAKFGVSAEQIVAAFSQMSPQTLAAPVSESTQAFVNELPLDNDQKSEAAAMYNKMLQQTGEKVFSEQMMGGDPQASVGTEVLGQKEYDQRGLDQSLKQMNQQFFQNAKVEDKNQTGKVSVAGMTAATGTLAQPAAASASVATPEAASTLASVSSSGGTEKHLSAAGKKSNADAASVAIVSGITSAFSGDHKSVSSTAGNDSSSQQQKQQQSQQQPPQFSVEGKIQPPVAAVGAFTPEMNKGKVATAQAADGKGKALKGDDLLNSLNSTLGQNFSSSKAGERSALGSAAMLPNAVQPNAEEKTANIQQLVKQAQVIIKQGGGEMKVQMSPEGMGPVSLRVAVDNGQVNIQMITHNKEAKKMIEEGLSELKASLAAHKLQVENLKVDLSEGISKQMQDQLADHQRNQAREMAQNFLSNMRDERQGFQQGFFENSGHRTYKNASEREGGAPQAPTASVASTSAQKKQSDRRLDMVA